MIFNWLSFKIDILSLDAWLRVTFSNYFSMMTYTTTFKLVFNDVPGTADQKTAILAHLASLTEGGEAAKLALPSRNIGVKGKEAAQKTFETAVKNFIATKTWDTMSAAERKFAMNASLTTSEYDSLTTS